MANPNNDINTSNEQQCLMVKKHESNGGLSTINTTMKSPYDVTVIVALTLYIITGVLQPTIIDYLRMHDFLGRKLLLIPTLANTSGMALCGLAVSSDQWRTFFRYLGPDLKRMILATALVDLVSGMCLTFGLLLTSGAVFVVLYNSCPAWTALLSRVLLRKRLNATQIIGVSLVSLGLVANVRASEQQVDGTDLSLSIVLGSCVVLFGSFLHSLMFVVSDFAMKTNDRVVDEHGSNGGGDSVVITGEIWSCCLGSLESTFMFFWVALGILFGGFRERQHEPRPTNTATTTPAVFFGFVCLVIVNTVHAFSFFRLLKNMGAVASALLKGVQAIMVIAISAVVYCPTEEAQCLTRSKLLSSIVVLSGVLSYGYGSYLRTNEHSTKRTTEGKQRTQQQKLDGESNSLI